MDLTGRHQGSGNDRDYTNAAAGPSRHWDASYPTPDVRSWAAQVIGGSPSMQDSLEVASEASGNPLSGEDADEREVLAQSTSGRDTPPDLRSMSDGRMNGLLQEIADEQSEMGMSAWCAGVREENAVAKAKENRKKWRDVKKRRSIWKAKMEKKKQKKRLRHRSYWLNGSVNGPAGVMRLRQRTKGPIELLTIRHGQPLLLRDEAPCRNISPNDNTDQYKSSSLASEVQEDAISSVETTEANKPSTPSRKGRIAVSDLTPRTLNRVPLKRILGTVNLLSHSVAQGVVAVGVQGRSAIETVGLVSLGVLVGVVVTLAGCK